MSAKHSHMGGAAQDWPAPDTTVSGFGEPLDRREDARLLAGDGRFVADLAPDRCLSMIFVRSPVPRAAIKAVHPDAARAAPDVVALYTGNDVASLTKLHVNPALGSLDTPATPILALDEIRAVGQPIVGIVAGSEKAALDAADRVEMDLEPLEPICDSEAAVAAPALIPGTGSNVVVDRTWNSGDAARAFANAAVTAEVTIRHPRVAPAPLEARATIAAWDADTQHLTIWSGTQTPHRARDDIARALGLAPNRVRVVAPDVGGAFGMKASIYPEDIVVAFASRALGRPVRWIASRQEDFLAAVHGRGAVSRGRMAFDTEGRILALSADLIFPLGAWLTYSAIVPAWNASRILPGPYAVDDIEVRVRGVVTNTAPVGIYRGAGRPEAAMLMDRLVDAGARKLNVDPIAVRLRSLVPAWALPLKRPNGTVLDSGDYRTLLGKTQALANYGLRRECQRRRRERDEAVGLGWSLYVEPCGRGWESASVALEHGGRFTAVTGSSSQGQGRETTFAQIAARELGVSPDSVKVVHGDTEMVQDGIGALASRSVAIGGSALQQAAQALVEKARPLASRLLNAEPSSIFIAEGGFRVGGRPDRAVTWERIVASADEELRADATYTADGEAWGCGCCLAQVQVDLGTGQVTLERLTYVDDAGTVINPRLVDGQIVGGIAQGLGEALLERVVYDADGQLLTGSLMDYALPRADDMPAVWLDRMCTPSLFNTLGAKGVGEAGTIGAPPAIVNAVLDALAPYGVEAIDMPMTPERVWKAIREAEKQGRGRKQTP
ncbi:MAG: xanthine dehydrogenase family protein molybdopterin-binding subunit [Rhodospirillales bacterium]|nr:xanthine dehydrogenase family protein molybdopterin-binding subunit [Rhodospirillales bacterium]